MSPTAQVDFPFDILVDPIDKSALRRADDVLYSASGRMFPIVQGVPVMLVEGVDQTIRVAERTLAAARCQLNLQDPWQLETTVLDSKSLAEVRALLSSRSYRPQIDPVINYLIGKTNGHLYEQLVGRLEKYPIPNIRLPAANAAARPKMLDVGCSWGRWSISAVQKGYNVVGLDPSLGAVLAGRRAARDLNVTIHWIVGDARYLPFKNSSFDQVFSYNVLQHFSTVDAKKAMVEIKRVLSSNGTSLIQMPNAFGIRSLYHQLRRRFRQGQRFEVRYYTPSELLSMFQLAIGPSKIDVDGFFGLGIQVSDAHLMPVGHRTIIYASELLRRCSHNIPFLKSVADSLYIESKKD